MRDWCFGEWVYNGPHWKNQNDCRKRVRDSGNILYVPDSEHYAVVCQFRAHRADRWGSFTHVYRDQSGASA